MSSIQKDNDERSVIPEEKKNEEKEIGGEQKKNDEEKKSGFSLKKYSVKMNLPYLIIGLFVFVLLTVLIHFLVHFSSETEVDADASKNGQSCNWMKKCEKKWDVPPLVVISFDGFARRYFNKSLNANMHKMMDCGVYADYIIPAYPVKTFTNHYSIATGLYSSSHGIIDNKFKPPPDSDPIYGDKFNGTNPILFEGEPIWTTVVKANKQAKTYMWMGSYVDRNGYRPTERVGYEDDVPHIRRFEKALDWLSADQPPALTMIYVTIPDIPGHVHGPDSDETRESVLHVDALVEYFLRRLDEMGILGCINFAIVSDHGMRSTGEYEVKKTHKKLDRWIRENEYPKLWAVGTMFPSNNLFMYKVDQSKLKDAESEIKCKGGKAFKFQTEDTMPYRYHYHHKHIGYPMLVGEPGTMFFDKQNDTNYKPNDIDPKDKDRKKDVGSHGWDNQDILMRTMFVGMGPSFKENKTLEPFENVEYYNLFFDLMKIEEKYRAPTNGTVGRLYEAMKDPPSMPEVKTTNVPNCQAKLSLKDCTGPCSQKEFKGGKISSSSVLSTNNPSGCLLNSGGASILWNEKTKKALAVEVILEKESTKDSKCIISLGIDTCPTGETLKLLPQSTPASSLNVAVVSGMKNQTLFKEMWKVVLGKLSARMKEKGKVRLTVGSTYKKENSADTLEYAWAAMVYCSDGKWNDDGKKCEKDEKTEADTFIIPNLDEDYNCIKAPKIVVDNRAKLSDAEMLGGVILLPAHMDSLSAMKLRAKTQDEYQDE